VARELAARLFEMAVVKNPVLREYYNAETGAGLGQTKFWDSRRCITSCRWNSRCITTPPACTRRARRSSRKNWRDVRDLEAIRAAPGGVLKPDLTRLFSVREEFPPLFSCRSLFFLPFGAVVLARDFVNVHRGLRELHLHRLHRFGHDFGHGEVAEPFVVGGMTNQGRAVGAGFAQRVLVGRDVIVPILPFLVIGLADFPVAGGVVQPLLEPPELALPG